MMSEWQHRRNIAQASRPITNHAILRYQERVAPISADDARQAILGAMGMSQRSFALPQGNIAITRNGRVLTILPLDSSKGNA